MGREATRKVAVLEYLCGGGLSNSHASESSLRDLFREGYGMLAAVAADLDACNVAVSTVLDPNMLELIRSPEGNVLVESNIPSISQTAEIVSCENRDWCGVWRDVANRADVSLVIAPEIDQELLRVVSYLRAAGCTVQISSNEFIKSTSDKLAFARSLPSTLQHPPTWLVSDFIDTTESVANFSSGRPANLAFNGWVLKNRFGAGCCGMSWYSHESELRSAIETRSEVRESPNQWIVQPWVEGEHASMAILCESSSSFSLLGVCTQKMHRSTPVVYSGGRGPILRDKYPMIEKFVRSILEMTPGAKGWIGIDFLYSSSDGGEFRIDDLIVVEINPRLTTSYMAYRQLYGPEIALGVLGIPTDSSRLLNHSTLNDALVEFTVA